MKKIFKNKKNLLIILTVVLILGVIFAKGKYFTPGESVKYFKVEKGKVEKVISSQGIIDSNKKTVLQSFVSGKIINFNAREGDFVEKGDVIAEIENKDLKLELEGINSQIESLEYQLKEIMKPADKEKINQLNYKINSANVNLESKIQDYENIKILYDKQGASKENLKNAKEAKVIAENEVKALENELALLKKEVSKNLKLQYSSDKKVLISKKKQIEEKIGYTKIIANHSGIITEKFLDNGDFLNVGVNIAEIADLSDIKIIADVLETEVKNIRENMVVIIENPYTNKNIKGRVNKIFPKVYSEMTELGINQKKVNVEIYLDDEIKRVLLNEELSLKFVLDSKKDRIRIPKDSYYEDENSNFVFVNNNGKADNILIEIGLIGEDFVEVKDGLAKGDKIIEVLENNLKKGMKIK